MTPTKTSLTAALGLSAALAAPALAGSYAPAPAPDPEPLAPAPVVVPVADWTGGYAGIQLGYGSVDANGAPVDGEGALYGVHGGYRWDMGGTVAGIEADYEGADIDLDGAADVDSVARLKGQLGYAFGETLAYGTAGAAWADTSLGDETGWLAGVGVARQITPNMTLGGELLYHDFDEFGSSGVGAEATTASVRASFRF